MIARYLNESVVPKNNDMNLLGIFQREFQKARPYMMLFPSNLNLSDERPGNWFVLPGNEALCCSYSRGNAFGGKMDFIGIANTGDAIEKSFGDYLSIQEDEAMAKKRAAFVRNLVKSASKLNSFDQIYSFINKEYLKCIDSKIFNK